MKDIKVINGDCRNILPKLSDETFDLILTDPPYNTGMNEKSSSTRLKNFFADKYSKQEYRHLVEFCANEFYRLLKNDKAIYIFINWKSLGVWIEYLEKAGFKVKNCIVWDKVVHGLNYQNYAYTHEFIIFATKGKFFPKNKGSFSDRRNKYFTDIWHFQRNVDNDKNSIHETIKPVELLKIILRHSTDEGDIVLDPFAGTGTTGVACYQSNRKAILIEKEKKYYDFIIKQLQQTKLDKFF